ncbi:MAG: DUF4037 domain-containing protein [Moorea sp. SIO3G5]|nr:DUF4037 domain-containing protein [Moorena sp. SIO3G5]
MVSKYIPLIKTIPPLAKSIATEFAALDQVVAVALAGSRSQQVSDERSDYDFYVYVKKDIPVEIRAAIAKQFAERIEINNQFWETGDEWIDLKSGFGVDVMYRTPQWIEEQLSRILVNHQASIGYSTCFWWNILTSVCLYDADGWFKQLQQKVNQPYPEPLKQAIIAKNYPILRQTISSYTHQLQLAIYRQDAISVMHRTTALLESYFDIIFAINAVPHPGEKRIIEQVINLCSKVPDGIEEEIYNITNSLSSPPSLIAHINRLIDGLEQLIIVEGYIKQRD